MALFTNLPCPLLSAFLRAHPCPRVRPQENGILDQRIAALRTGPDTVAEMEARNEQTKTDIGRLQAAARDLEGHLRALQHKKAEKREETDAAEARDPGTKS